MEYLNNLKENLNIFSDKVKPSSLKEIQSLEKRLNISLPKVLVEFFLLVGGDYDIIWGGGGIDKIETIDYTINLAKRLLTEASIDLGNYFPFSSYSDDQFIFVYLNKENNPSVFRFEIELFYCGDDYIINSSKWELPKGVSKVSNSFSEMIDEIIKVKLNA